MSLLLWSNLAAPSNIATWESWPQACILPSILLLNSHSTCSFQIQWVHFVYQWPEKKKTKYKAVPSFICWSTTSQSFIAERKREREPEVEGHPCQPWEQKLVWSLTQLKPPHQSWQQATRTQSQASQARTWRVHSFCAPQIQALGTGGFSSSLLSSIQRTQPLWPTPRVPESRTRALDSGALTQKLPQPETGPRLLTEIGTRASSTPWWKEKTFGFLVKFESEWSFSPQAPYLFTVLGLKLSLSIFGLLFWSESFCSICLFVNGLFLFVIATYSCVGQFTQSHLSSPENNLFIRKYRNTSLADRNLITTTILKVQV